MRGYKIVVTEQPPVPAGSIYCGVQLIGNNSMLSYGHMYFVCDAQKVIHQYPAWLKKEYRRQLEKLGYSF